MKLTYFAQNLKHLRKKSSKTQEQLGNEINLGRTTIANYESGVSSPTDPEVLVRLSHLFRVSIDELLTRDLSVAFSNNLQSEEDSSLNEDMNALLTDFIGKKRVLYETTIKTDHYMGTPKVIVVDSNGEEKMVYVSIEEAKNYINKREDSIYISSLPYYSLPKFSDNTYRIFEVYGNGMEPKFSHGDKVVGSWILNLEHIRDGNVYIVVTKDHGILLRRVVNRIRETGMLQLIADTLQHRTQYPLLELPRNQILEVWLAEYLISSNLDQPIENVYGKIADLEMKVQTLIKTIQDKENKG